MPQRLRSLRHPKKIRSWSRLICESMAEKGVPETEKEWKKLLTDEEYCVLRERCTERPFSGKYLHNKDKGVYVCAGCGSELFSSDAKFDSGSGWPSFRTVLYKDNVKFKEDMSCGMNRTEVVCSRCGSHLGHVFDDDTPPTGLRYCINSASLHFKKK